VHELKRIITALFYGRSGTGKTTLAGTFPKPMLFLDIGERGTDSVFDMPGIDSIQVANWGEVEEIYWELINGSKYKTIVIDAAHTMQALALIEARELANKKEKDQTSQRDFGQASGLMNTWIYNYRDLRDEDINVVFLAHDRLREVDTDDEDASVIMPEMGPRLMPGVAGTLLGAVNVVGYTFIREELTKSKVAGQKAKREVQYCLRIGPHGIYATKIRSPKGHEVPEYIVDPSYDKLVAVIEGKATPRKTAAKPAATKRTVRKISR
jgi:hypothetical protein